MWGPLTKALYSDYHLPHLLPDQNFNSLFMTVAAGTVALNIIYEELLIITLILADMRIISSLG